MKKCVHWRYSKSVIQIGNVMFSHVLKYNTERLYKFIKKCVRERERDRDREREKTKKKQHPKLLFLSSLEKLRAKSGTNIITSNKNANTVKNAITYENPYTSTREHIEYFILFKITVILFATISTTFFLLKLPISCPI